MGERLSISVVLPTFNRGHMIERAVRSVLKQLAHHDELIVVDDGSTDDTQKVLEGYGDRIHFIRTEKRGAGASRNSGVTHAAGQLVAFIDSE